MSAIKDFFERDKHYMRKKTILKNTKKKLGRCGRLYLWLQKEKIDQVVFIDTLDEAQHMTNELKLGKSNILCDLEHVMAKDINMIFEQR
jgi:hypothetical protein